MDFDNFFTFSNDKAIYTATEVACGWAEAVIKKANQAFGQEWLCRYCKNRGKAKCYQPTDRPTADCSHLHATKIRPPKGNIWSAIPVALQEAGHSS